MSNFRLGEIEALPVEDLICGRDYLELRESICRRTKGEFFCEALRVLKPGGRGRGGGYCFARADIPSEASGGPCGSLWLWSPGLRV